MSYWRDPGGLGTIIKSVSGTLGAGGDGLGNAQWHSSGIELALGATVSTDSYGALTRYY